MRSSFQRKTDRQADGRKPDRYITLTAGRDRVIMSDKNNNREVTYIVGDRDL